MKKGNSKHNCANCYWGDKCDGGGGSFTCEDYTPLDNDTYDEIAENEYREILQERNEIYDELVREVNDDDDCYYDNDDYKSKKRRFKCKR